MSKDLAKLISKMFISRTDVKAIQRTNGDYNPIREPWQMDDLLNHLSGKKTFGHYVVSKENTAKLFCFDIDLEQMGFVPQEVKPMDNQFGSYSDELVPIKDLRADWLDRKSPNRDFHKQNFHRAAHELVRAIQNTLEIPTAVAYSGSKGVHVYGFTGVMLAGDIRVGANLVLEELGCFENSRGEHMFKHKDKDNVTWKNLSIELYPKQDSLDNKDLGNLLRAPLGRNLKSNDPTFFLDMTGPISSMTPLDPIIALTQANPFTKMGE